MSVISCLNFRFTGESFYLPGQGQDCLDYLFIPQPNVLGKSEICGDSIETPGMCAIEMQLSSKCKLYFLMT